MPGSHERRRSRGRSQRVSRDESPSSETECRSRRRSRRNRRRERSDSEESTYCRRREARDHRHSRSRSPHTPPRARYPSVTPRTNNSLQDTLSNIMTRLDAIEHNGANAISTPNNLPNSHTEGNLQDPVREAASRSRSLDVLSDVPQQVRINNSEGSSTTVHADNSSARGSEAVSTVTMLAEALRSLQPTRSHNYYVSNFDPNIHDIDAWCEEVDRAAIANAWRDHECLSRVASCLKGDAKVWLNEWVTNDRTWSNFKLEFKPLCPRKLDYANILFEAMNTTSDKYTTYAEYARRTLLRLRIVKGLSDELRTLIVIRGIDNPQIRAAAANANLATEDIVSFLSIYVKPNRAKPDSRGTATNKHSSSNSSFDRGPKCYICNQRGHVGRNCIKKTRKESSDRSTVKSGTQGSVNDTTAASKSELLCSFCKKRGHTEEKCFAKNRSEQRNQRNVNLCASHANNKTDIVTAVVQGIPMDALIDSGAQNVSLISSDVLKHLSCQVKPTHCVLKGISEREIVASSFITATIELSDISIETDLVVVPKSCMNTSLIIGTDVLNRDGVTYVRTKDRQYITRASDTPACVNEVLRLDQTLVNTPLQGALQGQLDSSRYVLKNDLLHYKYTPVEVLVPRALVALQWDVTNGVCRQTYGLVPTALVAEHTDDDTDEAENRSDHLEGDNPAPASIGLSMPSLDEEVGTEQHPSAGASQEVQVEDDLLSGEAVLEVKE
uniref:SFRICE_019665 n=1 Tax=Spodoptera frugiperda TaxID=7108 RepID=A0A2H1WBQ7_SPOFR